MDKYIHRENLALLRKRLAETQDEAARKVLLKLLAEEEAKDVPLQERKWITGALKIDEAIRKLKGEVE